MSAPTFGSLFAGIGGIDLGLERAGWECRFQVEWDPFCQRVLAKHWPDVPRFGDIHDVHAADYCAMADTNHSRRDVRGREKQQAAEQSAPERLCPQCLPPVDLIAGGFPCQPFSVAGRRRGVDDDRWLWPQFARAIRELRPRFVLVENVPGLLADSGGMGAVLGDLAELGYDAEWESIPAAAVGAPHLRYRVWIIGYRRDVAYANGDGQGWETTLGPSGESGLRQDEAGPEPDGAGDGAVADAAGEGRRTARDADAGETDGGRSLGGPAGSDWWSTEPDVGRVAHGVPARVDRLRSLGNAVVPQVVEWIGRRLYEEAS